MRNELLVCSHCGRARPKQRWLKIPICYRLRPGSQVVFVICPECQSVDDDWDEARLFLQPLKIEQSERYAFAVPPA
jgi:hypothetical protein